MEKNELLDILRRYQKDFSALNDDTVKRVMAYMDNGMSAEQAVKKAMGKELYFAALLPLIYSNIASSACLGYGINKPSQKQRDKIMEPLLSQSWAADKIILRDRLAQMEKSMQAAVKDALATAKRKIKRMEDTAKELLDFLGIPKKETEKLLEEGRPKNHTSTAMVVQPVIPAPKNENKNTTDTAVQAKKEPAPKQEQVLAERQNPGVTHKEKEEKIAGSSTTFILPAPKAVLKLSASRNEKILPLPESRTKYIEDLPAPKALAHELPKYLRNLELAARGLSGGNKAFFDEYQSALRAAQYQMKKFAERHEKWGTPNQNLHGDYDLMIRAAMELAAKSIQYTWEALDRQIEYAIKRRAAYFAERVARTEAARAWFDGFIAKYQDDDAVAAYRWKLSSRHHLTLFDQCDVCANMDGGMGKGIYPKNKLPSIPRHPYCMCMLVQVYKDEMDETAGFDTMGARKYIDSLPDAKQRALFGHDGMDIYKDGGDWEKLLRGWDGFRKPKSRLQESDFQLNSLMKNGKIKEKLIADIKATGIRCNTVNCPPKSVDIDSLSFDDKHINGDRRHGVTEEEAKGFIKNAVMSLSKWNGKFEHYYHQNGVVYLDMVNKTIRTCYKEQEFGDDIKKVQEVLKKYD